MKTSEKLTLAIVVMSVAAATALYGVWEDKVWLFAPLLTLLYIALAVWAMSSGFRVQSSELKLGVRGRRTEDGRLTTANGDGSDSSTSTHPYSHTPKLSGHNGDSTSHIPHPTTHKSISIPPGGGLLMLFCLYSAIMIPFSVIPYEAKISTLRVGAYIGVYWATASILSRFPRRKAVWMTVFGFLILVALYSLVQHKLSPEMLFGFERYTNYGERLGGTYICPNHIAHLFQMWIPFCLVFLFLPQFGWFWRICFAYSIPLFAILIYQTQSRAGLLGLIAGLATTALLLMLRKSRRLFYIALLVVPLLGAGTLGGLWMGSEMFRDRMAPVVRVLELAGEGEWGRVAEIDFRPMTWADAFVMGKERPLLGVGPGNYGQTFPEHRKRWKGLRRETVHPHNEYLELFTEYGLIGAALIVWVLISFCIPMIRLIKTSDRATHALPAVAILAALAGTAVHGFFDFELRIFPNALMLSLLAGCAAAPLLQRGAGKQRTRKKEFRQDDG